MSDLQGDDVIGPRLESVGVEAPELVKHLGEVLTGLVTAKRHRKNKCSESTKKTTKKI